MTETQREYWAMYWATGPDGDHDADFEPCGTLKNALGLARAWRDQMKRLHATAGQVAVVRGICEPDGTVSDDLWSLWDEPVLAIQGPPTRAGWVEGANGWAWRMVYALPDPDAVDPPPPAPRVPSVAPTWRWGIYNGAATVPAPESRQPCALCGKAPRWKRFDYCGACLDSIPD